MSKVSDLFEKTKKVADAAGRQASDIIEKVRPEAEKIVADVKGAAKPGAEKIFARIKEKAAEISEKRKSGEIDDKIDITTPLNSVIEGVYSQTKITERKGMLFVGEKEISAMNCESYETQISSTVVASTKQFFNEYRKKSLNPISKLSKEKYLTILWRNGERSTVCIDMVKYNYIVKVLS